MYIDDVKMFARSEKELKILLEIIRIYSKDTGVEFDIKLPSSQWKLKSEK